MTRIKSYNIVNIYELNGNEVNRAVNGKVSLEVRSHWNKENFVVLRGPNGTTLTVDATDLRKAVNNATNA